MNALSAAGAVLLLAFALGVLRRGCGRHDRTLRVAAILIAMLGLAALIAAAQNW